jgi:hypothetical protein
LNSAPVFAKDGKNTVNKKSINVLDLLLLNDIFDDIISIEYYITIYSTLIENIIKNHIF